MRKIDELTKPESCMSRAREQEMTFVLLGRDICAPDIIRVWAAMRCARGKNKMDDPQILEALACAQTMENEHESATPASGEQVPEAGDGK